MKSPEEEDVRLWNRAAIDAVKRDCAEIRFYRGANNCAKAVVIDADKASYEVGEAPSWAALRKILSERASSAIGSKWPAGTIILKLNARKAVVYRVNEKGSRHSPDVIKIDVVGSVT